MTEEIEIKESADTKERPIIAARERGRLIWWENIWQTLH